MQNSYLEDSPFKDSPYVKHSTSDADNKNFSQTFEVPDWGIKDFIRERAIWQKGTESLTGETGWFYFKIFFKFNTSHGLFGGILDDNKSVNTAIEYLENCSNSYGVSQIAERKIALLKFVGSLSYINENAPWFFNSITGLNKADTINLNEPFKGNEIEIGVREDAVDMRLTTLFGLYKYACFDNINLKEIIPENLRKFDMTILVFHTPLRYYQTGFQSMKDGTYEYKSFNSQDFGDRMSYLMFTFTNCEFDPESINSVIPGEISNTEAFNLGKSSFKIKYKRAYKHISNEWSNIFFGDGIKFKSSDDGNYQSQSERMGAMETAIDNLGYYNRSADIYKPMVDAVEKEANDLMRIADPEIALGNIYWNNVLGEYRQGALENQRSYVFGKVKNSIDKIKSLANAIGGDCSMGVGSKYFKAQLNLLKYGDETLHGPNPYMPGTPYFKNRVKREKQGDSSLH